MSYYCHLIPILIHILFILLALVLFMKIIERDIQFYIQFHSLLSSWNMMLAEICVNSSKICPCIYLLHCSTLFWLSKLLKLINIIPSKMEWFYSCHYYKRTQTNTCNVLAKIRTPPHALHLQSGKLINFGDKLSTNNEGPSPRPDRKRAGINAHYHTQTHKPPAARCRVELLAQLNKQPF